MDFTGKIALVTGAAFNIGFETAKLFAENDIETIIAVDLNESGLNTLRDTVITLGKNIEIYTCDVSDEKHVDYVVTDVLEKYERVDILVNNAGIYMDDIMPFVESVPDMWKKKININIYGTLYFIHKLLPTMIKHRYGHIVNIASVAGMYGKPTMADYSLTKGGIIAFTKALAREVAQYGVLVNAVSPGNINPNPDHAPSLSYLNRSGSPRECAEMICFIASDRASFAVGENYVVDGCRKYI